MNKLSTRDIAISAGLASLSAVVQLVHIGYQSPQWGMWIDVVAVSWIIAYFLLGIRSSVLVSLVGFLIITLFAPDTWLGASMKLAATLPIIGSISFIRDPAKPLRLVIPVIVGIILRCMIVLPFNYYYAIPIWTGMTSAAAMQAIPWYVIAGFNVVQTVLDVVLAWIIVYRFKLNRYGHSSS